MPSTTVAPSSTSATPSSEQTTPPAQPSALKSSKKKQTPAVAIAEPVAEQPSNKGLKKSHVSFSDDEHEVKVQKPKAPKASKSKKNEGKGKAEEKKPVVVDVTDNQYVEITTKRLRTLQKKLEKIQRWEEESIGGKTLNPDQTEMVMSKNAYISAVKEQQLLLQRLTDVAIDQKQKSQAHDVSNPVYVALKEMLDLGAVSRLVSRQSTHRPQLLQDVGALFNENDFDGAVYLHVLVSGGSSHPHEAHVHPEETVRTAAAHGIKFALGSTDEVAGGTTYAKVRDLVRHVATLPLFTGRVGPSPVPEEVKEPEVVAAVESSPSASPALPDESAEVAAALEAVTLEEQQLSSESKAEEDKFVSVNGREGKSGRGRREPRFRKPRKAQNGHANGDSAGADATAAATNGADGAAAAAAAAAAPSSAEPRARRGRGRGGFRRGGGRGGAAAVAGGDVNGAPQAGAAASSSGENGAAAAAAGADGSRGGGRGGRGGRGRRGGPRRGGRGGAGADGAPAPAAAPAAAQ